MHGSSDSRTTARQAYCQHSYDIVSNSKKLLYHLLMVWRENAGAKTPAGISRPCGSDIQAGRLKGGDRLPSEAALVRRFGASRITIGRAVRDLQAAGLVDRRAGSGTFVEERAPAAGLSFGLLIPDLGETEIFEPICQGMMASPLAAEHALLWGSVTSGGRRSRTRVAGVPAVHRSARLRRVLRAARARRRRRTTSTRRSRGRWTRPAFPWCCSIVRCCPIRNVRPTTWSASTTAGPAT